MGAMVGIAVAIAIASGLSYSGHWAFYNRLQVGVLREGSRIDCKNGLSIIVPDGWDLFESDFEAAVIAPVKGVRAKGRDADTRIILSPKNLLTLSSDSLKDDILSGIPCRSGEQWTEPALMDKGHYSKSYYIMYCCGCYSVSYVSHNARESGIPHSVMPVLESVRCRVP